MYAEVAWVLESSGTQVQPQIIPDPHYLPDYLSVSYDYDSSQPSSKMNKIIRPFWTINKQKSKMAYSKDLLIILIKEQNKTCQIEHNKNFW